MKDNNQITIVYQYCGAFDVMRTELTVNRKRVKVLYEGRISPAYVKLTKQEQDKLGIVRRAKYLVFDIGSCTQLAFFDKLSDMLTKLQESK